MPNATSVCPACGEAFTQATGRPGRPRRWCSSECRIAGNRPDKTPCVDCGGRAWGTRCRPCEKQVRSDAQAARTPVVEIERCCNRCGESKSVDDFYTTGRTQAGFPIRRRECKPCYRTKLVRSPAYVRAQAQRDPETRYRWHKLTCEQCGEMWETRNPDGRFCSMSCCGLANRRPAEVKLYQGDVAPRSFLPRLHPVRRPVRQPRPRVFVEGPCAWCGDRFTVVDQRQALYCSTRCSRAAGRAARGRFLVPPPVRQAIYDRDGWVCQLCDDPVDPELHPTDPWAATLDHIVPRSWTLVPNDSPTNLRLAHRWCNSVRGDERYYTEEVLRSGETAA